MNKITEFEMKQCEKNLTSCQEMLLRFSIYLNQSVISVEESISATRYKDLAEFNSILDSYQELFSSTRKIKEDLEKLNNKVSRLKQMAIDINNL